MDAKFKRFEAFYEGKEWKQYVDKFPVILIIADHKYNISSNLTVRQFKSFSELASKYVIKQK